MQCTVFLLPLPLKTAQNSTFLFLCQCTEFLLPLTLNTAQNTTFLFLYQCTEFLLSPSVTTEQMSSFPPSLFFVQRENLFSPSLPFLSTSNPFPIITHPSLLCSDFSVTTPIRANKTFSSYPTIFFFLIIFCLPLYCLLSKLPSSHFLKKLAFLSCESFTIFLHNLLLNRRQTI